MFPHLFFVCCPLQIILVCKTNYTVSQQYSGGPHHFFCQMLRMGRYKHLSSLTILWSLATREATWQHKRQYSLGRDLFGFTGLDIIQGISCILTRHCLCGAWRVVSWVTCWAFEVLLWHLLSLPLSPAVYSWQKTWWARGNCSQGQLCPANLRSGRRSDGSWTRSLFPGWAHRREESLCYISSQAHSHRG